MLEIRFVTEGHDERAMGLAFKLAAIADEIGASVCDGDLS
jgi:hypothetical protein